MAETTASIVKYVMLKGGGNSVFLVTTSAMNFGTIT
jgi:hypothetical protein